MSKYDYDAGRQLTASSPPFYALIQAAMRGADTENLAKLRREWPETWAELEARYNAPGGWLPGDPRVQPDVTFPDDPAPGGGLDSWDF